MYCLLHYADQRLDESVFWPTLNFYGCVVKVRLLDVGMVENFVCLRLCVCVCVACDNVASVLVDGRVASGQEVPMEHLICIFWLVVVGLCGLYWISLFRKRLGAEIAILVGKSPGEQCPRPEERHSPNSLPVWPLHVWHEAVSVGIVCTCMRMFVCKPDHCLDKIVSQSSHGRFACGLVWVLVAIAGAQWSWQWWDGMLRAGVCVCFSGWPSR